MKIASVIVWGGRDFRQVAKKSTDDRVDFLGELVEELKSPPNRPDLVLFPAGYFCCAELKHARSIAGRVSRRLAALSPGFDVLWGIDVGVRGKGQSPRKGEDDLPYYGYAWTHRLKQTTKVKQVSASAEEGRSPDLMKSWGSRQALVPGTKVAMLICGETWSDRLLQEVECASPEVLAVLAHHTVNLMRKRSGGWSNMSWHLRLADFVRRTGIPVVLAETTGSTERHKYCWPMKNYKRTIELEGKAADWFSVKLVET